MTGYPVPENEDERLAFLGSLRILDTPIEERFERITRLVCRVLEVPIAAISLIDKDRQWFKSIQGAEICETPREGSFCGNTIMQDTPLIISNAELDHRFKDSLFVTEEPFIRFYVGIPLIISNGINIGTLCVYDREPKEISEDDIQFLEDIAATVTSEIKARLLQNVYG